MPIDRATSVDLPTRRLHQGPSLTAQLALFVSLLLVLTVVGLAGIGYSWARSIVREQIHGRLQTAAEDRRRMIENFVTQQQQLAGLISSRTQLRRLVADFQSRGITSEQLQSGLQPILDDAQRSVSDFRAIWLASPDGSILAATNSRATESVDFLERSEFQAAIRGLSIIGRPFQHPLGLSAIVASPAYSDDRTLLAVVLVLVNFDPLVRILHDDVPKQLEKSGEILVATRTGETLQFLLPSTGAHTESLEAVRAPELVAAIEGHSGVGLSLFDGEEVLAYYEPVRYQPRDIQSWGLMAHMNAREAYAPLASLRLVFSLFTLGLLGLALLLTGWWAKRFTRPIEHLSASADRLAAGNLDARAQIDSDDELGVLGESFNNMAGRLQDLHAHLEQKVLDRTAALQRERDRSAAILETASDAFIAMDDAGKITAWNATATRIFGWTPQEAIGRRSHHPACQEGTASPGTRSLPRVRRRTHPPQADSGDWSRQAGTGIPTRADRHAAAGPRGLGL